MTRDGAFRRRGMEPTLGFEPRTCCLRNSCSTAELCRPGSGSIREASANSHRERDPSYPARMATDRTLRVTEATREDVATFIRWAAAEGWNPGRGDLEPFLTPDPH